jgi:Tfp pilus assembly protein PilF
VPSSTRKRSRSANRARTTLPRKRRATANQLLARRGMIILGIVVAGSLVVALLGTVSSPSQGSTATTPPSSQSDPNQLIRAVTANPNDANAIGALADYYYHLGGQPQQALILYQKYVTLRPNDALARVTLGELLFGSGDLAAAQSQLVQTITFASATTDPQTTARAHLDLGDVYTALQPPRQNDALAEYKQASDLDPSGDIGDQARTKLAALQQQVNVSTVTVVAPSAPARPTGTP